VLACRFLTFDLWDEQLVPAIGTVDVARPQPRRRESPSSLEEEERMVADGLEMPVVGAAFLLAVHRTLAGIHVEHDAVGADRIVKRVEQAARNRPRSAGVVFPVTKGASCSNGALRGVEGSGPNPAGPIVMIHLDSPDSDAT
jgi:hypothetical protein